MVEDNFGDAMLISEMLKEAQGRKYLLQHNLQLETAFESLSHKNFDIILLDLGLPDSMGLNTLKKMLGRFPSIPVVILTGLDDEELGFEAVKMGAQDFLIKGQIDSNLLLRTIRYSIERKKTEELMRENEERFRATFEQAAVGIAHVTFEGSWLMVNRKFCELSGYEHSELLGLKFQDIIHKDDLELDQAHQDKMLSGAIDTYSVEKRFMNKKERSAIWVNLTFSLVKEAANKPGYLIVVAEDITGRKNVEKAMQEIAHRLSIIFHDSPSGIAISTLAEGKYLDINEAFEKMTGFHRNEVIGHTPGQLGLFSDLNERDRLFKVMSEKGDVRNMEVKLRRKSGGSLPAMISAVLIDVEEKPYMLSVIHDMTEPKKVVAQVNDYA